MACSCTIENRSQPGKITSAPIPRHPSLTQSQMNCLIYARVSTDKQADKELSIPAQLQAMRHYANQRNWQILQEFADAGASGRTTARPMLHQLLVRCRNPHDQIDVVLVHKIDRLARNVADHAMI